MVTLRVHIDPCDERNGPLEIIRGSHEHGRLDKAEIAHCVEYATATLCLADSGDVLAMRPLLLHRSQRANQARRRRILHLDYGPADLPGKALWAL
jgi:ectoine hydroxylase-related dioxygenase (phytanoyl-CoA dioxygenase family)